MAKRATRKVELYAVHAHDFGKYTYEQLFEMLADLPASRRVHTVSGIVVGLPVVQKSGKGFFVQITEGDPESSALVFNSQTGQTRETDLAKDEVLSQATHMMVAPTARRAAIEFSRRGIKALAIGPAIEGILGANYKELRDVRMEFVAVTTDDFIKDIRKFDRIRLASLRVTRPNASWTDHYTDLSELLEDSDGDKVEIDVRAGRGKSLKKTKGIVKIIKDVAQDQQPYLDDAAITGTRSDEESETTIRSSQHVEHTKVAVAADDAGVPERGAIRNALSSFLSRFT